MVNTLISFIKNQKFVKDSIFTLSSQVILAGSGILLNVLLGNYYGPSGLGIFNQTLSYFMLISIIANLGIPNSLLKYTAEYKDTNDKIKEILSTALFLNLFITVIIIILFYLFINYFGYLFLNEELAESILVVIITTPIFVLNKNLLGFLNGLRRMKEFSFFQSLRWLLILVFVVSSMIFGETVQFSLYSLLFSELILFIFLIIKLYKYIEFRILHSIFIKKHLDFGIKTIFTLVVDELSKAASILMIGYFLGNDSAGIYSFASSIALGILMLPGVIQTNFNPIISNYYANNQIDLLQELINKLRQTLLKIMIPINLVLMLVYPVILMIFMKSPEYSESYFTFYILMVGVSAISLYSFSGGILSMAGLLKDNLVRVTISMGINLILNILLIPTLGIEGAAIAVSFNYIISIFLLNYFMKTKMRLSLFKNKLSIV